MSAIDASEPKPDPTTTGEASTGHPSGKDLRQGDPGKHGVTLYQPEPVEISTRMRPGEWTEESLNALVGSYREKLLDMGASASEIEIETERDEDGGVSVVVTWIKSPVTDAHQDSGDGII